MSAEILLSVVVAVGAALLTALLWRRASTPRRILAGLCVGLITVAASQPSPRSTEQVELEQALPVMQARDTWRSSDGCKGCHPGEHASWHRTYHRTMTREATPEHVKGPFTGQRFELAGRLFQLDRRGDAFFTTELKPEPPHEVLDTKRIVMLTGSHHLQGYWVKGADGLLIQLPFVYLIREQRWLPNRSSFLQPREDDEDDETTSTTSTTSPAAHPALWADKPGIPGTPTTSAEDEDDEEDGELSMYVWSEGCAYCHSTGPREPETRTSDGVLAREADVVELGIACESCHGEARQHAELYRDPTSRYAALHRVGEHKTPQHIVNPKRLKPERASAVCGRCHSVTGPPRPGIKGHPLELFKPGEAFSKYYDLAELDRLYDTSAQAYGKRPLTSDEEDALGAFWPDHTVRIAGREYNGMTRSKCMEGGEMTCMTCHAMHGDEPDKLPHQERGGEASCVGCHASIAADRAAHTHHKADGPGSACLSCHMPHTSYGLLMTTRSHRIDSPRVTGIGRHDRPNACNLCHLDRTLAWTADRLKAWYGVQTPALPERHTKVAASALWILEGDAAQRAITAWHLGYAPARQASDVSGLLPVASTLLLDPYDAVRQIAANAMQPELPPHAAATVTEEADAGVPLREHILRRPASKPARPELLHTPAGTLDVEALRAHIKQRDDRDTWISE